jgi:hypothetical protein
VKRWAAVALVVIGFSGCANYVWEKSGASALTAEQDARECERQARLLVSDYESLFWSNPAWPWPGPIGWRSPAYLWTPDPGRRLDLEMRAAQSCMEAKGYRLVKQPRR